MNYLKENDDLEEPGLDATTIIDFLEAVRIIQHYKEIIKPRNKTARVYLGKQGQLLKKFRKIKQFFKNVE